MIVKLTVFLFFFRASGIFNFQNLTIDLGGVLRIFNNTCTITGHTMSLNNGSKVEIYKKLAVYSTFLYLDDTIIDRNVVDSMTTVNTFPITFMTSNKSHTKVYNNVLLRGSILENHGIMSMEISSQISAMTSSEIVIGQVNTNIISYLELQPYSTLLLNSDVKAAINAPIWSKSDSIVMIYVNSTLYINGGGICDNKGVFNISGNSEIVLSSKLYVFFPLSQIIGSGLLDIETVVYPPVKLLKLPEIKVSKYGTMYYTNNNVTNTRLGYDLDSNYIEILGLSRNEKYISEIFIDGGGIRLDKNVSVLINNMTLYSGGFIIDHNSTITIVDKFSYYSGIIEGNESFVLLFSCEVALYYEV
jgi:hypothetical protein